MAPGLSRLSRAHHRRFSVGNTRRVQHCTKQGEHMKSSLPYNQASLFKMNKYHNSVGERRESVLQRRDQRANKQNQEVLQFFRMHQMEGFSPSQVWNLMKRPCPLTSIRRSISDLTKDGWLYMTRERREGLYPPDTEGVWVYAGKTSITK